MDGLARDLMQTAFQPGAFQASGFQIVAETVAVVQSVERDAGGWGLAFRREQDWLRRRDKAREEAAELEREIDALEQHIAEERNVSRETVRLEAKLKTYEYLPPAVLQAAERALKNESARAFRQVEVALRKFEQDEEEEFAVLLLAALH